MANSYTLKIQQLQVDMGAVDIFYDQQSVSFIMFSYNFSQHIYHFAIGSIENT